MPGALFLQVIRNVRHKDTHIKLRCDTPLYASGVKNDTKQKTFKNVQTLLDYDLQTLKNV